MMGLSLHAVVNGSRKQRHIGSDVGKRLRLKLLRMDVCCLLNEEGVAAQLDPFDRRRHPRLRT